MIATSYFFTVDDKYYLMKFIIDTNYYSKMLPIQEEFFSRFILFSYSNLNCSIAKEGKFGFYYSPDSSYVIKTQTHQIDTYLVLKATVSNQIEWIDDCSYKLIFESTDRPDIFNYKKGDYFTIIIYETTQNSYKYIFVRASDNFKGINELIKLE